MHKDHVTTRTHAASAAGSAVHYATQTLPRHRWASTLTPLPSSLTNHPQPPQHHTGPTLKPAHNRAPLRCLHCQHSHAGMSLLDSQQVRQAPEPTHVNAALSQLRQPLQPHILANAHRTAAAAAVPHRGTPHTNPAPFASNSTISSAGTPKPLKLPPALEGPRLPVSRTDP